MSTDYPDYAFWRDGFVQPPTPNPIPPWSFHDGAELGSYNTMQHWATHSDGLFLVYTRRDADDLLYYD